MNVALTALALVYVQDSELLQNLLLLFPKLLHTKPRLPDRCLKAAVSKIRVISHCFIPSQAPGGRLRSLCYRLNCFI